MSRLEGRMDATTSFSRVLTDKEMLRLYAPSCVESYNNAKRDLRWYNPASIYEYWKAKANLARVAALYIGERKYEVAVNNNLTLEKIDEALELFPEPLSGGLYDDGDSYHFMNDHAETIRAALEFAKEMPSLLNFVAYCCATLEVKTGGGETVDDAVAMHSIRLEAKELYERFKPPQEENNDD